MDISVVIVNYNVRFFLEQCILSIQAASKKIKVEIIVVDNNSQDDSCQLLQNKYPEVLLISNKNNVGFSKANNQGVAIAKGEFVFILNPDTVLGEDTLEKLYNFAKNTDNIGIVGTQLIDGSGTFLPESKRGIPTPSVAFLKLFGFSKKQQYTYYARYLTMEDTGKVAILAGACMFMKRAVYKKVGGFDEDYFMYGEDIDLSYKVLKLGLDNYYYADTKIIHYKGESTTRNLENLKNFNNAMHIFYKKHFNINWLYNFVTAVGIKLWFVLNYLKFVRKKTVKSIAVDNAVYVGEDVDFLQQLLLKFPGVKQSTYENLMETLNELKYNTIIFDNAYMSNKAIIDTMILLSSNKITFKIKPKKASYIVGSFTSKNKGKIIEFNKN